MMRPQFRVAFVFLVFLLSNYTIGNDELSAISKKLAEIGAANDAKAIQMEAKYCDILEKESCEQVRETCKNMPAPNICQLHNYYNYFMDFQVCGDKMMECSKERLVYQPKVQRFIEAHYIQPGFGRSAVNSCRPFYEVKPSLPDTIELSKKIEELLGKGTISYFDYKEYYQCIEEQYKKIIATSFSPKTAGKFDK